jgi:hypothetical protein
VASSAEGTAAHAIAAGHRMQSARSSFLFISFQELEFLKDNKNCKHRGKCIIEMSAVVTPINQMLFIPLIFVVNPWEKYIQTKK